MKPHKSSKCDVCATPYFERNNYFYGKQFTVRDLLQEQSYFNEKRYLINRMVLGWGVVCGLEVKWDEEKCAFVVGTGMALDCCGREIIICEPKEVPFEEYGDQCRYAREQSDYESRFVLCLEYDDCFSESIELPPIGCDEEERSEFNRVRDGFKLRIKKWEDACPKEPSEDVPCLDRFKHDLHGYESQSRECETETIHHYLCRKLKRGCPECEECDCVVLATILVRAASSEPYEPPKGYQPQSKPDYEQQKYEPSKGYQPQGKQDYGQQKYEPPKGYQPQGKQDYEQQKYEPAKGYQPGGKQDYEQQKYEPAKGYQPGGKQDYEQQKYEPDRGQIEVYIDTCTYRRFVYNNKLLYDLIYCHHGDLPHIVDFNWPKPGAPNRELEWDDFVQLMKDGLVVYFDREMVPDSLNAHTFFVSFFHEDPDSGNLFVKRIPAREVNSGYDDGCYKTVWLPDPAWYEDELLSQKSQLRGGVDVEITLRGSRIWDSRGKGLDGAFLADKLPTGNGTQGTEFVDWFSVLPREDKKGKAKSYNDY
jgi:hypothetical protein